MTQPTSSHSRQRASSRAVAQAGMDLDQALSRVSKLEFPPPSYFVSHAPMACEALDSLGMAAQLEAWVESSEASLREERPPVSAPWAPGFDWEHELGKSQLLPEWMGFFSEEIEREGWRATVSLWVPRLMPGLSAALFHGVIRTSHAVRALGRSETPARQDELARALAHWAVWFRRGEQPSGSTLIDDACQGALDAAAAGVGFFVEQPTIVNLHGVTGAMAVHLLGEVVTEEDAAGATAQLRAEHQVLYRGAARSSEDTIEAAWDDEAITVAAASFDPHQVKLVEACRRGFSLTQNPTFILAARRVTNLA